MGPSIFSSRKLTASGNSAPRETSATLRKQVCFRLLGLMILASCLPTYAAEADPLKPPAIQTEEVPAVPPEFAARLSQYQNTRAAGFAGWDPAGQGMLIRTRFGNSVQLHRVYQPGGRREQITFLDEPVEGSFIPKATDEAILLSLSAGGSENDQVYLLDRANFKTTLLTDGKSKNRLDAISPDGKRIVLGSTKRNGRDTDLYLADPRQPGYGKLLLEVTGEFWSVADWSPDGKKLLLVRYVSANEAYPAILDIESGERTDLPLPTKEKAAIGALAFASDDAAWIATDARGEFKQLSLLELAGKNYFGLSTRFPGT